MSSRHRLSIARAEHKLSCAHMTVFPDGTKERLHGHNYQLGIALEVSDVGYQQMVPFAELKSALSHLCHEWKERVLIAEDNPHFELVRHDGHELEFRLCGDRYVLPRADAVLLPIDNVSVEGLAAYLCKLIRARLSPLLERPHVLAVEIEVSESPGQSATCRLEIEHR